MGTGFNGGNSTQHNACYGTRFNARGGGRLIMYIAYYSTTDSTGHVARIDPANGSIIWTVAETTLGLNNVVGPRRLGIDKQGDCLVLGTKTFGTPPDVTFNGNVLVKAARGDGSLIWMTANTLGGPADFEMDPLTDRAHAMFAIVEPDGSIVGSFSNLSGVCGVDSSGYSWVANPSSGTTATLTRRDVAGATTLATITLQAQFGSLSGSSIDVQSVHVSGSVVIVTGRSSPLGVAHRFILAIPVTSTTSPQVPAVGYAGTMLRLIEAYPPTPTRWTYITSTLSTQIRTSADFDNFTGAPAFALTTGQVFGFPAEGGQHIAVAGSNIGGGGIPYNLIRLRGDDYSTDLVWGVLIGSSSHVVGGVVARQI